MSELVKLSSLSNPLELCSDHFSGQLCWSGGIKKDPTVWLDVALPPLKYDLKNNMNIANSNI